MNVHLMIARLATPLVWRNPRRSAKLLFEFAHAEQGSMLDLVVAAQRTESKSRRADYIRHLLDEKRHAQIFTRHSAELCRQAGIPAFGNPHADIEYLFDVLGEKRFLAFVHLGEYRAQRQFAIYRDWLRRHGNAKTAAMFDAILKDEQRHEQYTWDLLVKLKGSEDAAHREVRRARGWEAWRKWRRTGRALANRVFVLSTLVIYVTIAPYALLLGRINRERTGWSVSFREREIDQRSETLKSNS